MITRELSDPPATHDDLTRSGMRLLDKLDIYEQLIKDGKLLHSKSSTNGNFTDIYLLDRTIYTLEFNGDNFTLTMDSTHWR